MKVVDWTNDPFANDSGRSGELMGDQVHVSHIGAQLLAFSRVVSIHAHSEKRSI